MNWIEKDDKLTKEFTLKGFSAIANALPKIAEVADEMNHHPDFEVYGYSNIKFSLSTHSKNQVTELDHTLAEKIDAILNPLKKSS